MPDGRILNFVAGDNDEVASELAFHGYPSYEAESTELFRALARNASVVMDIGAHTGLYALLAAWENPSVQVFGFEAAPSVYELLLRNVAVNGLTNLETIPAALTDRDGEIELYVPPGQTPTSASTRQGFRRSAKATTVAGLRGDTFVRARNLETLDVIKIDTESTEPAVLRGLHESLERFHPVLLCEVLHGRTEDDLTDLLPPLGYRAWRVTDRGLEEADLILGDATYTFTNYLFAVKRPAL
jgi:FkbM family methyltransferase